MLCEYLAIIELLEPHVHVKYKEALAGALVNIMYSFNQINDFLVDIIMQEINQSMHALRHSEVCTLLLLYVITYNILYDVEFFLLILLSYFIFMHVYFLSAYSKIRNNNTNKLIICC